MDVTGVGLVDRVTGFRLRITLTRFDVIDWSDIADARQMEQLVPASGECLPGVCRVRRPGGKRSPESRGYPQDMVEFAGNLPRFGGADR